MIIFDGENQRYEVKDRQGLIDLCDNNSLIQILKSTYFNMKLSEAINSLLHEGVLESQGNKDVDMNQNASDIVEALESIIFLKEVLIERTSEETVASALKEIDDHIVQKINE